jgi:hypothetical protein
VHRNLGLGSLSLAVGIFLTALSIAMGILQYRHFRLQHEQPQIDLLQSKPNYNMYYISIEGSLYDSLERRDDQEASQKYAFWSYPILKNDIAREVHDRRHTRRDIDWKNIRIKET